jgi:DnaK suppressor protein
MPDRAKGRSKQLQSKKPVKPRAQLPAAKPVSRALAGNGQAAKTAKPDGKRRAALHRMLMEKRQEVLKEIGGSIGHSLTEEQQRRLQAAMDVGDQALMDLDRELGISLLEMQNRKRQMIDEALTRLSEGTYGICAECGTEIGQKRLAILPFAKLCVQCQSKQELLERIEKEEERF